MAVWRPLPLLVALLLVSCDAAVTASPTPEQSKDEPASGLDHDSGASAPSPVPSPSAPVVAAATETPHAGLPLASVKADFDCDGLPDLLEFFNAPRAGGYVSLETGRLARLTRSWGGIVELPFDGMPGDDPGRNPPIGVADVNGDGCDDAIIVVGHGASTTWTTFLVFDGSELRRVEEDGKPVM